MAREGVRGGPSERRRRGGAGRDLPPLRRGNGVTLALGDDRGCRMATIDVTGIRGI